MGSRLAQSMDGSGSSEEKKKSDIRKTLCHEFATMVAAMGVENRDHGVC